jgi:hypothetical protein
VVTSPLLIPNTSLLDRSPAKPRLLPESLRDGYACRLHRYTLYEARSKE